MIVNFIIVSGVTTSSETLRGAGLNATRQRMLVLDLLTGRERPMAAQQVHEALRAPGTRIGLTTVYRALHALVGAGLLHTIDLDGETAYRMCGPGSHHHLICRACGLVTEGPPIPGVSDWLEGIRSDHDFHHERHRVEIQGICGACHHREHPHG